MSLSLALSIILLFTLQHLSLLLLANEAWFFYLCMVKQSCLLAPFICLSWPSQITFTYKSKANSISRNFLASLRIYTIFLRHRAIQFDQINIQMLGKFLTGSGQVDGVKAYEHKGRGFESFHRKLGFPLDSLLLAAARSLKWCKLLFH